MLLGYGSDRFVYLAPFAARGAAMVGAPPHSSRFTPRYLPLKGKALRFCGGPLSAATFWFTLDGKRSAVADE